MSDYNNNQGSFSDRKNDNNFALIVVLFVLLIIVGVSFMKDRYEKPESYRRPHRLHFKPLFVWGVLFYLCKKTLLH